MLNKKKPRRMGAVSRDALIADLIAVAKKRKTNHIAHTYYHKKGKYPVSMFTKEFGTWNRAIAAAGLSVFRNNVTVRHAGEALRLRVYRRDNYKCKACGISPATHEGVVLNVDHIIPFSKGGKTNLENLQTLCAGCNMKKRDSIIPRTS